MGNGITIIQNDSDVNCRRHIPSKLSSTDILSRGCTIIQLSTWKGIGKTTCFRLVKVVPNVRRFVDIITTANWFIIKCKIKSDCGYNNTYNQYNLNIS